MGIDEIMFQNFAQICIDETKLLRFIAGFAISGSEFT